MNEGKRKLAAIMFTDIVGFTALMAKDEENTFALIQKQRKILKPLIKKFSGVWIKEMGDGTLSCFHSAVNAVECAIEIQQEIKDYEFKVRIGVHVGDVIFSKGDVFGDGVNIASRIEPLAQPGEICISDRVYEEIRYKPNMSAVYIGKKNLKNVNRPIKVYAIKFEGSSISDVVEDDTQIKKILHYEIKEKLGRGGMGIVYKAIDTKLNRIVALKFIPEAISEDETILKRFKIEAQAVAALQHQNIATIFSIEETPKESFLVFEYVKGRTLRNIIEKEELNIEQYTKIAKQILEGLSEAHNNNVIHRDITSTNVMVTDSGNAKILDFGLAKLQNSLEITQEKKKIGTISYMSPEQSKGKKIDHRTDLWSWGVLFYEIITGQKPFKGSHDQAIIYNILNEAPQPPQEINKDIDDNLNEIILKCIEKSPEDRFQTAADILGHINNNKSSKSRNKIVSTNATILSKYDMTDDFTKASKNISCNILIDSSQSMKGFVNTETVSNYSRVVKEIEHSTTISWLESNINYFKFSLSLEEIERKDYNKATKNEFYDSNDIGNHASIYDHIKGLKLFNNKSLALVVTDLFEQNADIQMLVSQIKKELLPNSLSIGVLGVKSQFTGIIDNITDNNFTFQYDTKGASSYRPFYILMIGSYGNIKKFYENLNSGVLSSLGLGNHNFAIFSKDVLKEPLSFLNSKMVSSSELKLLKGNSSMSSLVKFIKVPASRRSKQMVFRFDLNYLDHTLVSYFEKMELDLSIKISDMKEFTSNPFLTKGISVKKMITGINKLDIKIEVDWFELPDNLPYFCSLSINPTYDSSRNPNWFKDWDIKDKSITKGSLKNDTKLGCQTYNLTRFLNSLSVLYTPKPQNLMFVLR